MSNPYRTSTVFDIIKHLVNRRRKLMVSIDTVQYCKCIFSYGFLNISIFIIRIQYILHITYKICDNQLFMLFKASGQKKAIKFWRSQEFYVNF